MTTHHSAPRDTELIKNSARLIRMRWLAGLAILIATPIGAHVLGASLPEPALYALGAIILACNGLMWWASRRDGTLWPSRVAIGQVAFDWLALAIFVHLTGGIESPAIAFFLFHILLASILLPGRVAYLYAALVIGVVGGIAGLEAIGRLAHYRVLPFLPPDLHRQPLFIASMLSFFGITVLVTVSLVTSLVNDVRDRERRLATLYQTIEVLPSSLDLSWVLDQIVQSVTHALRAKAASIRLLDSTGDRLKIAAAYGLSQKYLNKGPVEIARSPIDQEALHGRPIIIEETTQDKRFQYPSEIVAEGIHSILCAALIGRRGLLGVLRVYGWRPGFFNEKDAEFVAAVARQGAMAIENAMAYGELRRTDETKSQFVRAVTHELRSPVVGAQSLLRTVTRDLAGGLNDLQRDVLRRLSDRLDALKLLIDDLLDLAAGKVEGLQGELTPVSLEAIVLAVLERLSSQAEEKKIDLKVDYVPRGLIVTASEEGLGRIFLNLIGNAIKYTPAGGKVSVALEQQGGEVIATVSDTGMGIPEVDLPHVFEEFYRASNVKQNGLTGTGLGLAIVKDLVERYQGRVSVRSTLGQGSTFTVALPLAR
ncbi:MAG TPA: GAF domain-containing sensor histidine kinase [Anaerolineae bacterium]